MHFRCLVSAAAIALVAGPPTLIAQTPAAPRSSSPVDRPRPNDSTVDHANMDHAAHRAARPTGDATLPVLPGQAAYGAIGEVVRLLKADPATDWSRVNVEALRQHLIDMDEVTMRATVTQRNVPGGLELEATGSGRTAAAIRRMAVSHAKMLDQSTEYHATAQETPGGVRLTVTARNTADARAVAQIRGLGFAGLMTEGDHHAAHHMALARGTSGPHEH